MKDFFLEAGEGIKINKFLVLFCVFVISLSFCACGYNGTDTETAYQMTNEESSATDMESQSDDEAELPGLRYDGLYCYINDFDNNGLKDNFVLRFYEDGVVIGVSIEQRENGKEYFPKESWFNRETESHNTGNYECVDDKISFTTADENGTVDYDGTIRQNQLVLDVHFNINDYDELNREYVFYPFEEIPNWYVSADEVDDTVTDETAEAGNGRADDEIIEILEESADPEYDLDCWIGKYEFGEFIDSGEGFSLMFYAYEMEIYKENDRYYADIEVNGHMVGINLRAKLYGNDEWVSLVIDEYYPEHIMGYSGMENSVFLSMERRGEDIYTYWGIMTPLMEDEHMAPGIYLEKETGGENVQTWNTEETDGLKEWVGEYAFSEKTDSGNAECFYHLDIFEEDGQYYADLVITGNGMDVCVKTRLHGDDQWASLVLEEYYPEHKSGLEDMENMVLLSLRRQGENIYTYWGRWDVTEELPNGRPSYNSPYYHSHIFFETVED